MGSHKALDQRTVVTIILDTARLNSGYVNVVDLLPTLVRYGVVDTSSVKAKANAKNYICHAIGRSKLFEHAKDSSGKTLRGIYKLKEFK